VFFKKSPPEAVRVVGGRALSCIACGHGSFRKRHAQLNTLWATFFNLEWLNEQAACYVCAECKQVHWFAGR